MEITGTKLLCFNFLVFFLSIVAALLRYNAHTIEFIHVYNSVFFSIFAELCNYQYNLIWEHFHHPPKETLCLLAVIPYSSSSISGETSFYFFPMSYICQFWTSHGTIRYVVFHDWLLPALIFSRFIHVVALVLPSSLKLNNMSLCRCTTLCLSSALLMDIWVVSIIMYDAAKNSHVHVFDGIFSIILVCT